MKTTNIYVGLFTSEPIVMDGLMISADREVSYKEYARQPIGWKNEMMDKLVFDKVWSNKSPIIFPQCGSGRHRVDSFKVFSDNRLMFEGQLSRPLDIWEGVTPEFASGDLEITMG